jgi:type IV pilus assembly protein PilV
MNALPTRRRLLRRGFSLIEVLVSTVLVTVGLIGVVSLQARAVNYSVAAEDQLRASLLANEVATQMWTQRTVNLPTGDITAWQTRVANATGAGLPNAEGTVTVAGNTANIRVEWRPVNAPATAASNRFVTDVILP